MNRIAIELTEDQANTTLFALENYSAFAVYGEGREAHQAFVQRIIDKLAQAKTL